MFFLYFLGPCLVVVALALFVIFRFRGKRKGHFSALEKKYRLQLNFPIEHHLQRLEAAQAADRGLSELYQEYQERYRKLEEEKEATFTNYNDFLSGMMSLKREQRLSQFNLYNEQFRDLLVTYQILNDELINLLAKENEIRITLHQSKEQYRRVYQIYSEAKSQFIDLDLIDQYLAQISERFDDIDEQLLNGRLQETTDLISLIAEDVAIAETHILNCATLIKQAGLIRAERIKKVDEYYHTLSTLNLELSHLHFPTIRTEIDEHFQLLLDKLMIFNHEEAAEEVAFLSSAINQLMDQLEQEDLASRHYNSESLALFSALASLRAQYLSCQKIVEQHRTIYLLKTIDEKTFTNITATINELEAAKNQLIEDKAANRIASELALELERLSSETGLLQKKIQAFLQVLKSYRIEAETMERDLGELRVVLSGIEAAALALNCPDFQKATKIRLQELRKELANICDLLHQLPINLEEAFRLLEQATSHCSKVEQDIHLRIADFHAVAEKIIKLNNFRLQFSEVDFTLAKVEECLNQGDFEQAHHRVVALEKFLGKSHDLF